MFRWPIRKLLKMTKLVKKINLSDHDELYEQIIDLQENLSDEERNKANAKLILLLMNHIGDLDVIREAIHIADPRTI